MPVESVHTGSRVQCLFAVSQLQRYFPKEQQKPMTQVSVRIQVVCNDFGQTVYLIEGEGDLRSPLFALAPSETAASLSFNSSTNRAR